MTTQGQPAPRAPGAGRAGHAPTWLILLTGCWIAGIGNIALWRHLATLPELHNARGIALGMASFIVIMAGSVAVLALLNWRAVLKPMIALLLIAAAIGVYFMLTFGVVLDLDMMTNVLQTNAAEAGDLLGWRFFSMLFVIGVLPALWVWRVMLKQPGLASRAASNVCLLLGSLVVMAAAVLLMFQDFASLMRNHPQLRYEINPFNSIFSLVMVELEGHQAVGAPLLPIGRDARLGNSYTAQLRPPLLVLVLGETARAANFGIDGYARATTPYLAELDAARQIVNHSDAWSCGTNTAASLPCMFSHLGRTGYGDRKGNHETLLDVLQHAGLAVLWIDNQSGCKGVCDRVTSVSTTAMTDPAFCSDSECFDEIMLKQLDAQLAALSPERLARGAVVVMHQMGSHGPAYFRRSPAAFKAFQPECESPALQACSQAALVNAYDNAIRYTDHFLHTAIEHLNGMQSRFDTALMYVSDHGESLGENNLYLHGLPYRVAPDVQKHVPWITWLSPSFEARSGLRTACLRGQANQRMSHDNYFHSVLGLMDVKTAVYRLELDSMRHCAGF